MLNGLQKTALLSSLELSVSGALTSEGNVGTSNLSLAGVGVGLSITTTNWLPESKTESGSGFGLANSLSITTGLGASGSLLTLLVIEALLASAWGGLVASTLMFDIDTK
jgi:hypothetical protein